MIMDLLGKYNVNSIDELEDILEFYNNYEIEDNKSSNLCLNIKYFPNGIPLCRRVIEIYNTLYKENFGSKKNFILHLINGNKTLISLSSINNYMSCKQCKKIDDNQIIGNVNDIFLQDICNNLDIKLDRDLIFNKDYKSIKSFHKILLDCKNRVTNSISRELLLAQEAFNRGSYQEVEKLLEIVKDKNSREYIHLKAKLLSNKSNDKQAIKILQNLISIQHPNIDIESYNLLGASIKREAFKEFNLYGDNNILVSNLLKSKDIYQKIFNINRDYYPAINIAYIKMIISILEEKNINIMIDELKLFWQDVKLDKKDYWSCISNIEFLIITKDYNRAKKELNLFYTNLNRVEISNFKRFTFHRQLEIYMEFCDDIELIKFKRYLNGK